MALAQPEVQQAVGPKGDSGAGDTPAGLANRIRAQQGTPASQTRAQQVKPGEASAAARMVTVDTVPVTAEAPKSDCETSENGRYVTVWVPDGEETEHQCPTATVGLQRVVVSLL